MILVIDDDRAIRSTLVYILERNGYETQNAEGPERAMEIVRKKPIALVALTSLLLLIGLMDGGLVGVFERGKN